MTELHLNATLLSLKLLLSTGRNISYKKQLCDLFLNEDSIISTMIFSSQPRVEHTCGVKRTVMQNVFAFCNKLILEPKMKQ